MIKVQQMQSVKSFAPVNNQYIITEWITKGALKGYRYEYFQSYNTIIAIRTVTKHGQVYVTLDEEMWNYSRTTGKYRNRFLGEDTAETRKKIKKGVYLLGNLN